MARQLVNWQDAWRAYVSGAPSPVLHFRSGLVLRSGPRDSAGFLFLEVFANGCYRRGLPRVLSGTVVDLGANIGAFTLDITSRFRDVTVHAYEPDPDAFAMLIENIRANRLDTRVRAWNEAVAGTPGPLELWQGNGSIAASAYLGGGSQRESRRVASVTLQTVIGRCDGRVTLLKMDCEGSEADILDAPGLELNQVDRIVAEYHAALVPDVIPRLRRALEGSFEVVVSEGRRCGPMLRAVRR